MITGDSIAFQTTSEGRYDRHALISWWDQSLLSGARVIVAGAGALGNEVLKLLALTGVGQITVVDFDRVSTSNLARTVLFRQEDIGRPKVEAVAERLRELNPEIEVRAVQGDLRFDLSLSDYHDADLVFGCLDSVNARWALNRKCFLAGVDWIDGGISDHHGLVAYYSPTSGACYECNFTSQTYQRFNQRYSCPYGLPDLNAVDPTPTTAVTSSAIAALQVQQGLLHLHGRTSEALQPGERLLLYLKPFSLIKDRLPVNPDCMAHESLPAEIPELNCNHQSTVTETLQAARDYDPGICALGLPYDLVASFHCPRCNELEPVNLPKEKVFQEQARCPKCGELRIPETLSTLDDDPKNAHLRLEDIGIAAREILIFKKNTEQMFLKLM